MGVLEELRKMHAEERKYIVKAKKKFFKGQLFGHISNGGGIAELEDGLCLKFTAIDDKFISIELIDYGKYDKPETQSWIKTKEVSVQKAPQINIKKRETSERKTAF